MTTASTAADPDVSPIIERLESIHHDTGVGLGRVFRDWTTLAVCAFARDDEAYHDCLDRYAQDEATHQRSAEAFSAALGDLVAVTCEVDRPVIGDVYERIGARSDRLGQHFTPWTVAAATARMNVAAEDVAAADPADPLTVADPACGSGRLLIAVAKQVYEMDEVDGVVPLWVRGTDTDPTCARMAVMNLVLASLPGLIRHGDSLTQEVHRAWAVDPVARPVVTEVDPADVTPADGDNGGDGCAGDGDGGDGDDGDAHAQVPADGEADPADRVEVQADLGRWSG